MDKIKVIPVDPKTFEYQTYSETDNTLISASILDTNFNPSTDYIEYYAYNENKELIFPTTKSVHIVDTFRVEQNDVILNPSLDLTNQNFTDGSYFSTYNFYRNLLGSNPINEKYFISEISSDRTEIRLNSNNIKVEDQITSAEELIKRREDSTYFVDFLLNFGSDQQVIANNIAIDNDNDIPSVLIKLYEPLPLSLNVKSTLWVVEEISHPQAYNVVFPTEVIEEEEYPKLQGPNFNLNVKNEVGEASQEFNYNTLINSDVTSSFNQIQNLLKQKGIKVNVNYEDYNQFVKFSSALTRLENFYYKATQIESSSLALSSSFDISGATTQSAEYSASKARSERYIQSIIENFDGYEYFLYFNSGSQWSWPKSTSTPPYQLYSTGSSEVADWIGAVSPSSSQYGGVSLSASQYDESNQDYLYYSIPEYLRDDSQNTRYILFVDMVGQHYDNVWLYAKDITNKFNADNRLDYGISKDLVADAIKDFGVKLYSNNFNTDDLYTAFLGLTPSGSTFPIQNITGSIPVATGDELVLNEISASNDVIGLDDVNKRVYKRIYHNIPYLLKTKGTIAGLRALITSYGIPDTILRTSEFGGRDKTQYKDWDYEQHIYNKAYHLDSTNNFSSQFSLTSSWATANNTPKSLQLRFKTPGIPTASAYYNVWVGDSTRAYILLEYTGSSNQSGSYSGSIPSEYNKYGTLKFFPEGSTNTSNSASLYLPFFDGDWWSIMATVDYGNSSTASLYAANKIENKIGFSGSTSIPAVTSYWTSTETSSIPFLPAINTLGRDYAPLTGALQEVRYWDAVISESVFYDYVMNPYSTEGNTLDAANDDLAFRASLGTDLNTSSYTSIHPKVTGSWESYTSSFATGSNFTISDTSSWTNNRENIYYDQVNFNINSRITDKIQLESDIIPTGSTLSPFRSVRQKPSPNSGSTPNINYLEAGFSPQNQIDDDIVSQLGTFNLGDYIGDPRQISESGVNYPNLDEVRDKYFKKYINSYNVTDFVRLIKFFDNSLFKMIDDFSPARTSLSSGVIVKQNLLERNRQAPPTISNETSSYEGLVKPQARDYSTGSSDTPAYSFVSGSSIYTYEGGTGGTFESFNTIYNSPISSSGEPYSGLTSAERASSSFAHRYPGVTQSFSQSVETPSGSVIVRRIDQREFYDGDFQYQALDVGLNEICKAYFGQDSILDFTYRIQWFDSSSFDETSFLSSSQQPGLGNVWIWSNKQYTGNGLVGSLDISQNIQTGSITGPAVNEIVDESNYTNNGSGTGATIRIQTTGSGNELLKADAVSQGSGYNIGDILTISKTYLSASLGLTQTQRDLKITLSGSSITPLTASGHVEYIKMSTTSANGNGISNFITTADSVTFNLNGAEDVSGNILLGPQTWNINSAVLQGNSALIYTDPVGSSTAVNSLDTLNFDFSFSASGLFSWQATSSGLDPFIDRSTGITASIPQGYFPPTSSYPTEQFFRGWESAVYYINVNGTPEYVQSSSTVLNDPLGNFNTGSREVDNDNYYLSTGEYKASSLPWFINASSSQLQLTSASTGIGIGSGLEMYTGSITQSSIEFGITYTTGDNSIISSSASPTLLSTGNSTGPFFTAVTSSNNVIGNLPSTLAKPSVFITTLDPALQWKVSLSGQYISGNSGPAWISVDSPYNLGYHTGTATVTFTVIDGVTSGKYSKASRKAKVTLTTATTNQTFEFYILQIYNKQSTTGPGGGGIRT